MFIPRIEMEGIVDFLEGRASTAMRPLTIRRHEVSTAGCCRLLCRTQSVYGLATLRGNRDRKSSPKAHEVARWQS